MAVNTFGTERFESCQEGIKILKCIRVDGTGVATFLDYFLFCCYIWLRIGAVSEPELEAVVNWFPVTEAQAPIPAVNFHFYIKKRFLSTTMLND